MATTWPAGPVAATLRLVDLAFTRGAPNPRIAMANVLFLAPADLGETVLATGALAHESRDGDKLTVVCAPDATPLFRAAPGLVAVHQSEGIALWLSLMRTRFDVLVDARNGLLGRTLSATR